MQVALGLEPLGDHLRVEHQLGPEDVLVRVPLLVRGGLQAQQLRQAQVGAVVRLRGIADGVPAGERVNLGHGGAVHAQAVG